VRRSAALILSLLPFVLFVPEVFGQAKPLALSSNKIVINGAVKSSDYSFSQTYDELTLYVNRTSSVLDVAVVADTTGWVAVGLGSLTMDGATIFIGFMGLDGKVSFKPQAGSGHSHHDVGADVRATIISFAIKETAGKTTMQLALRPAAYIKPGQSILPIIFAFGTRKSFLPLHAFHGALSLPLA